MLEMTELHTSTTEMKEAEEGLGCAVMKEHARRSIRVTFRNTKARVVGGGGG